MDHNQRYKHSEIIPVEVCYERKMIDKLQLLLMLHHNYIAGLEVDENVYRCRKNYNNQVFYIWMKLSFGV